MSLPQNETLSCNVFLNALEYALDPNLVLQADWVRASQAITVSVVDFDALMRGFTQGKFPRDLVLKILLALGRKRVFNAKTLEALLEKNGFTLTIPEFNFPLTFKMFYKGEFFDVPLIVLQAVCNEKMG